MKWAGKFARRITTTVLLTYGLLFWGCQPSPQVTGPANGVAGPETVYVVFEGPWAFVTEQSGEILAIAPKAKNHSDAYVKAKDDTVLPLGKYNLTVANRVAKTQTFPAPTMVSDTISSSTLTGVVNKNLGRYMVILPQPDGFAEAERSESEVNYPFPVDPQTAKTKYTVSVALQYTVSDLSGFKLTGTPDDVTVSFSDVNLELGVPRVVHIAIDPLPGPSPDPCDDQTKQAFKDVIDLFALKHFIDFLPYPSGMDCHPEDPQNPNHPVPASARDVVKKFKDMQGFVKKTAKGNEAEKVLKELSDLTASASGTSSPLPSSTVVQELLDVDAYLKNLSVKDSDKEKLKEFLDMLPALISGSRHRTGVDCKAAMVMLSIA
jgi:hypothetical protein